ncbi:hypothetical protein ASF36_09905 [Methylobacterium sp. Leaf90]|nr:hypothetical protein ASF36_09905 [Methylobacterium sp. Leaf90]
MRAAVHEAGHGLVVASAMGRSVVLSVHAAGGLTELGDIDKVDATTVAELEDLLVMMLVGRAAEEAILGDVSAGPSATWGRHPLRRPDGGTVRLLDGVPAREHRGR